MLKRPWPVIIGFLGLALVSPIATSDTAPESAASFRYQGYALAQGQFQGDCQAGGVLSQPGLAGWAVITSEGGTWEQYNTTYNRTTLWPNSPSSVTTKTDYRQDGLVRFFPAGNATLSWPETGRANIFLPQWPNQAQRTAENFVSVSLAGHELQAQNAQKSVDAHEYHYKKADGQIGIRVGGIGGWNRLTTISGAGISVDGDLAIYLENAHVAAGTGELFETSPRTRFYPLTPPNDVVSRGIMEINHVVLRLTNAHVEFSEALPKAACGPIDLQVQGTFTALGATGTVSRSEHRAEFDRKEFTINGTFRIQDEPADLPLTGNTNGVVEARSEGEFRAVGIDFAIPKGLGPEGIPADILVIATTAAAGLGALAWMLAKGFGLFTRLSRTSVEELPNRVLIMEKLREDPWVGLTVLVRGTGLPEATLRYHLRVLERERLLLARGRRKGRLYAAAGQPGPEPFVIGSKKVVIPEDIRSRPVRQRDLMAFFLQLGFRRSLTWYSIKRWEAQGRLVRTARNREVWYEWRA